MGVYIKGLKLPSAERQGELLILTDDGRCVDMFSGEYEAVELQPHGRLIDADAIPYIFGSTHATEYDTVTKFVINRLPTIIEGEEET